MEKVSRSKISVKRRNKDEDYHKVNSLEFTKDKMIMDVDGNVYGFLIKEISHRLAKASQREREAYEIIASGYGIHWPLIDEDLSIDGLIRTYNSVSCN